MSTYYLGDTLLFKHLQLLLLTIPKTTHGDEST